MDARIAIVGLWAEDVPAAAHFYRDVIGLPLLGHHGGRPHFGVHGTTLVILQGRPVPAQDPDPARFPLLALEVPDLDAAVERLRTRGIDMPWGIEESVGARWAMFHDPGGNLIELATFSSTSQHHA